MTKTTGPEQHPSYVCLTHRESLNFHMVGPEEIKPGDQYAYKIVMTVDEHGKSWWATKGLTSWSDDYVRDHGDKIREELANLLFPLMQHLGQGYYYRS